MAKRPMRRPISHKKYSRAVKRGYKTHPKNLRPQPMRGGYRL